MTELRPLFRERAHEVVERFYEHLLAAPELEALLADPATVERLKAAQRTYLVSLTDGVYGEAYAATRLTIGRVHERIGLEPQWYLGTYGLYFDLLLPLVRERFADEPALVTRASAALSKLLVLDMQLVLDAYWETRRRRELQRNEQLAAVGELAASIAHEVRNPLAGMKGALEILRGDLEAKPQNLEIVHELLAQIGRLENLVRDLLAFARPSTISVQRIELHELIDRMLRAVQDDAEAAGITVERTYGPGTSVLHGDPPQIEQVFSNLLQNAMQAMENGGTLAVSTRAADGRIVIGFRDTGRGIPAAHLGRVFQPFFTTRHRGSGLGLPIVKKIVEAHAGTIEIESAEGEGTTVTVALPAEGES